MKAKNFIGFFAAVLALVFVLPAVSAFADIDYVVVDGSEVLWDDGNMRHLAVFAGDDLNLKVVFNGLAEEDDVRVSARILGEPGISDMTERFDVLAGRTYSKQLSLSLPNDIDPAETFTLEVSIEAGSEADTLTARLEIQRSSYVLDILSVEADSRINAGETLALDVVVENDGRQDAENNFVKASIPALGISRTVFLGDLSPENQDGLLEPEMYDSAQGRVYLNIPSDAPAGLYTVEIEAFNDDTTTTVTKRLEVLSTGAVSSVITSSATMNFAVNEEASYSFTIVNSGDSIRVYTLIPEVSGLTVNLDESIVAVPAGSSKTVRLTAMATDEGNYNFKVNVHAADGELVGEQNFVANVEGKAVGGSAAVVLTIVLAIVFLVLLIVLIVLLTRKPEKSEDFGESYY